MTNNRSDKPIRILLAPDKFKGSMTAMRICEILNEEISTLIPDAVIENCPLADGGDGSIDVISSFLQVDKKTCSTVDPMGRQMKAIYYTSNDSAYIELASASGLVLLSSAERNPMITSTYGTGLMIKDAIKNGARKIYLFLGGSATNDGGMGIARALGFQFLDQDGNTLEGRGNELLKVNNIVQTSNLTAGVEIILCSDVENPPSGYKGAAHVFAKQKGANPFELIKLDAGTSHLCSVVTQHYDGDIHSLKGGGAAGAVAVSLVGLMDSKIISGIEFISEITDLERKIQNADIVISGEGKLDLQSIDGKVVSGVADLCRRYNKRLMLIVGKNDLSDQNIELLGSEKVFDLVSQAKSIDDAITKGEKYLRKVAIDLVTYNLIPNQKNIKS